MKVAASPRVYMERCPKAVCKSPVTSHLFLVLKLWGSGWCGLEAPQMLNERYSHIVIPTEVEESFSFAV